MDPEQLDAHSLLRSAIDSWKAELTEAQESIATQLAQAGTQLQRLVNELSTRNNFALELAAAQNQIRRLESALPEGALTQPQPRDADPSGELRQELLDGYERYCEAVGRWTQDLTRAHHEMAHQVEEACAVFRPLLDRLDTTTGNGHSPQILQELADTRYEALERERNALQQALQAQSAELEAQVEALRRQLESQQPNEAGAQAVVFGFSDSIAPQSLEGLRTSMGRVEHTVSRQRAGLQEARAQVQQALQRLMVQSATRDVTGTALAQAEQEADRLRAQIQRQEKSLLDAQAQAGLLRRERDALAQQHPQQEVVLRERDALRDTLAAVRDENLALNRALEEAHTRASLAEARAAQRENVLGTVAGQAGQLHAKAVQQAKDLAAVERVDRQRAQRLARLESALEKTQARATEMEQRALRAEEEYRQSARQLGSVEDQLKQMSALLVETTAGADTQRCTLEAREQQLSEAVQQLDQTQEARDALQHAVHSLGLQAQSQAVAAYAWMQALEEQLSATEAAGDLAELRLAQRENQLELQAEQIAALKRAQLVQEDLLQQRTQALETASSDLAEKKDELARLRGDFDASLLHANELGEALSRLEQRHESAAAGAAEYALAVEALTSETEDALLRGQAQRENLEAALAQEQTEHQWLREQHHLLQEQHGQIVQERDETAVRLREATAEILHLEMEAEAAADEQAKAWEQITSERDALEKALIAAKEEGGRLEEGLLSRQAALETAQGKIALFEAEQQTLYGRLAETHAALQASEQRSQELETQVAELGHALRDQQESWGHIQRELEEAREAAQQQAATLHLESGQVKEALGFVREQLEASEAARNTAEHERSRLARELPQLLQVADLRRRETEERLAQRQTEIQQLCLSLDEHARRAQRHERESLERSAALAEARTAHAEEQQRHQEVLREERASREEETAWLQDQLQQERGARQAATAQQQYLLDQEHEAHALELEALRTSAAKDLAAEQALHQEELQAERAEALAKLESSAAQLEEERAAWAVSLSEAEARLGAARDQHLQAFEQERLAQEETRERLEERLRTEQDLREQGDIQRLALQENYEALQASLEEQERALIELQTTHELVEQELHAQVQAAKDEAAVLQRRAEALERERDTLLAREEQFAADLRERNAQLDALRMDQQALEELLDEQRAQTGQLRVELDERGLKLADRDQLLARLNEEREEVESRGERRDLELAMLRKDVEHLRNALEDQAQQLVSARSEVQVREEALQALRHEHEEARAERAALQARIEAESQQHAVEAETSQRMQDELHAQLHSSSALLEDHAQRLGAGEAREAALQQEMQTLREHLAALQAELAAREQDLAAVGTAREQAEQALERGQQESERERQNAAELRKFLNDQKEMVAERNATLSLVQTELRELQKQHHDIQQQVQTFRTEARQASLQLSEALRERDRSQEALERARSRATAGVLRVEGLTPAQQKILVSSLLQAEQEKLGRLLCDAGVISEDQLQQALREQQQAPGQLLGSVLLKLDYAKEEEIAQAIACQLRIPFVQTRTAAADPEALRLLDRDTCMWHVCLPLKADAERIVVAMANPQDATAIRKIQEQAGRQVAPCVATPSDILAGVEKAYGV